MKLVYIVEDDENIREIESFALTSSGCEVKSYERATDFFQACANQVPTLAVLDIMLPGEDGLAIVRKMRRNPELKRVPVLMVTAKTTEMDKVKGLDYGADDYLAKPFGVMELIARVNALIRRTCINEEKVVEHVGHLMFDEQRHLVQVEGKTVELTYKEFELLKLILQNIGIVLTRSIIMDKIWGVDYEGESRTLDMHIKTLRHKLGSEGQRIKTIRNIGYLMER